MTNTELRESEFAWLIEHEESPKDRPRYLSCGSTLGSMDPAKPYWSEENEDALRFARRKDALDFMHAYLPDQNHRIAEHGWSKSAASNVLIAERDDYSRQIGILHKTTQLNESLLRAENARLLKRIEAAQERAIASCDINPFTTRICERETLGCDVRHAADDAMTAGKS